MLLWVAVFLAGVAIGGLVVWTIIKKQDVIGTLFFYDGEPGEPPAMCSELNETPEDIGKRDYVIFKVSHR